MAFKADDFLIHHGIKGMKWGIRRYQNPDGTLTPAGIKRYGTIKNYRNATLKRKDFNKEQKRIFNENYTSTEAAKLEKRMSEIEKPYFKESGFETGDLYDPEWKNRKGNSKTDRDIREYSKLTDRYESAFDKSYKEASNKTQQALRERYGGGTYKEVRKNVKKNLSQQKGKQLYKTGHTIENNMATRSATRKGAALINTLGAAYLSQSLLPKLQSTSSFSASKIVNSMTSADKAVASAIVATNAAVSIKSLHMSRQNKHMREYWWRNA